MRNAASGRFTGYDRDLFCGDSNIALAIGAVLAIITLGKRLGGKVIIDVMDKTLKDAGPIVFITSAGGALGQVLKYPAQATALRRWY